MKALILAAGLGSRLRLMTSTKPKALVELKGRPLLDHAIEKVRMYGFDDIIVNVHHFADQVEEYLYKHHADLNIKISDERHELLGSGGAIKHAEDHFGDYPFLVYNVDVLSDINLTSMMKEFIAQDAAVMMAVRDRETQRKLLFNNRRLCGWKNKATGDFKGREGNEYAFSGIQIIHPNLLDDMPTGNFSIIDHYLSICEREKILAFDHSEGMWMDLGTPERLKEAESHMKMKSVH